MSNRPYVWTAVLIIASTSSTLATLAIAIIAVPPAASISLTTCSTPAGTISAATTLAP
jgi:hypothetical protein